MPLARQTLSRRDAFLVLIGASCAYVFATVLAYGSTSSSIIQSHLPKINLGQAKILYDAAGIAATVTLTATATETITLPSTPTQVPLNLDLGRAEELPETSVDLHAPGWTLFRNLYMANGTFYIVSSLPASEFPEIRMMTSTGLPAFNTPENIALREPTNLDMEIITPAAARQRWAGQGQEQERHWVRTIEGSTMLYNDPSQFLDHYYHFVAELLFGTWAFLYGAFNPTANIAPSLQKMPPLAGLPTQPSFNLPPAAKYQPAPPTRAIFMHAEATGWRDKPGFNSYFLHAVFPSISVEVQKDWADRVAATAPSPTGSERAWHFPLALLADRSAAHRGEICGTQTQRTAAESWDYMRRNAAIDPVGGWWSGIREAVLRFAGDKTHIDERGVEGIEGQEGLPLPDNVVITYINRQGVRRHLIQEDHDGLVAELEDLVRRKKVEDGVDWELNIVQPELMSKDDQVKLIGRTTILLGVHGNGLTHLVMMKPTRTSAVIEMFYPGGFAHDYEWTTRALGMRHFSVWNDTYFTHPNEPPLGYPEGFQGTSIPINGLAVAKLIEDRLEGRV
ncbi:hypothetical protein BD779DRAFT_1670694 [Infundibulicybe gibba]|nr:hypothetical protein BD779DRAFT_1670694 [Infundibulicybe gibba]